MKKTVAIILSLLLAATLATAADKADKQGEVKELSGMSIIGNDEAPKSLYIIPWKSSEIGGESSLSPMIDTGDDPVDRDTFIRQLEFYETSTNHQTGRN